jgi:hypothetical protein
MIVEEFKLVFSSPKYTIARREIEIQCVNMERGNACLHTDLETFVFLKGNILVNMREIVMYRVVLAGRNNLRFAKQYFLQILAREAEYTDLHRMRYFKCLDDLK